MVGRSKSRILWRGGEAFRLQNMSSSAASSGGANKRKLGEEPDQPEGLNRIASWNSIGGSDDDLMHNDDKAKCKRCAGFEQLGDRLDEFIKRIPKTDLHVHLDGSLRLSTLIELARQHNVTLPAYTEAELRQLVFKDNYDSLDDYLRGFPYITAVMQQPDALERIAYEFAVDNFSEGVHYVEPRFAPQLLATSSDQMDIIAVLKHVNRGLDRAKREFNAREEVTSGQVPPFEYCLIVCAMRMFLSDFSAYYKDLMRVHKYESPKRVYQLASIALVHAAISARNDHGLPVVGIDIAGAEKGFPAVDHRETFELAHKNFLFKTVHGGEDWGPESIFQAITDLHAERVGHGYNIFNVEKCTKQNAPRFVKGLVEYVAKNRIMLEVCLTSNRQTMPELRDSLEHHALKDMLAHGLCISINTDNRLVSNTTVCKELRLAIDTFGITPNELKTIVLEGFKRAFHPGSYLEKRHFVRQCIGQYEKIEKEFGLLHHYSTSLGGGPREPPTAIFTKPDGNGPPNGRDALDAHFDSPSWTAHTRQAHEKEPPEILM